MHPNRKSAGLILLIIVLVFTGCASPAVSIPVSVEIPSTDLGEMVPIPGQTMTPFLPVDNTATPTYVPTNTPDVPTLEPTNLPTLAGTASPDGTLVVPILLYHHIPSEDVNVRYFVSKDTFRKQMEALKAAKYSALPISALVSAIRDGTSLPARPVIITFDDGFEDVYQNAFPIMKDLGMVGTLYIIVKMIGEPNCLTADQIKEMAAAGWEIGSHSMSHPFLTRNYQILQYEVGNSRQALQDKLGVPVNTFAYPYGAADVNVIDIVKKDGYTAGIGVGPSSLHSMKGIYFMARWEVTHEMKMDDFLKLLPWK